MTEQKAIKVFPHTYTNGGLKELNNELSKGWYVKQVVLSVQDNKGNHIYDYILEREKSTQ